MDRVSSSTTPHAFGATHAQRVRELADSGHATMTDIKDWDRLTSRQLPGNPALVLTHGDPGPGNYLDDAHAGTLIDWEEAHVAPRGLDMARAMFIVLLGAGPEGFIARDHAARSRAVAVGYLHQLGGAWQPHPDELRGWLTVAGIQYAHRRWQRAGQPRSSWEIRAGASSGDMARSRRSLQPGAGNSLSQLLL